MLITQVTHTLAILLWVATILAFIAGLPQLGWVVLAIIVINAVFSFWQEYRAERVIEALHRRLPNLTRVRRDGMEHLIEAVDLVPGDILILQRGDRVAADARLTAATGLRLDYSLLTGESEPVDRNAESANAQTLAEACNCVLAGTTVVDGDGEGVVFATGANATFGTIAALTEQLSLEPSPLQKELASTARILALVAFTIGVLFSLAGSLTGELSRKESFLFGIGILVALVPEGLLPTVSLALALAVRRMADHNAIVKRLASVEALGSTSVICTDKTGTITTKEMTALEVWAGDNHLSLTNDYHPRVSSGIGHTVKNDGDPTLASLLRCGIHCNNAPLPDEQQRGDISDPLDTALLVLAAKLGIDPSDERNRWQRIKEFPFDAKRRRMSTLHNIGDRYILFAKGAPEETLGICGFESWHSELSCWSVRLGFRDVAEGHLALPTRR